MGESKQFLLRLSQIVLNLTELNLNRFDYDVKFDVCCRLKNSDAVVGSRILGQCGIIAPKESQNAYFNCLLQFSFVLDTRNELK